VIVTFDANVLVYATTRGEVEKGGRARDLIGRGARAAASVLLLQTLGEFAHVALRKSRYAADLIEGLVGGWMAAHPVHPATPDDVSAALACVRDHKLQFWDAMLWATARRVGVRWLLTEDLQDGRVLGGVRFVNPFLPGNAELIDKMLPR
jgi:predicted nucleic acid-binding protein